MADLVASSANPTVTFNDTSVDVWRLRESSGQLGVARKTGMLWYSKFKFDITEHESLINFKVSGDCTIESTTPLLKFVDATASAKDFNIKVESDILNIEEDGGNTVLQCDDTDVYAPGSVAAGHTATGTHHGIRWSRHRVQIPATSPLTITLEFSNCIGGSVLMEYEEEQVKYCDMVSYEDTQESTDRFHVKVTRGNSQAKVYFNTGRYTNPGYYCYAVFFYAPDGLW